MIDVVIPVYRGFESTRRCIESVLASAQRAAFTAVVVDDAGPEPAIAGWLDSLARDGRIELLRNGSNQGFVRSVNRGMALHPDRDVLLLNSDTEVANDWLDRIRAAAYGAKDVGTVTPFSNNATICSYPFEGWSGGGVPGTLGLAALDRLFAETLAGRVLDIPTAVGFCMFIRRDCLAQVGTFDADRFGRGYGEENDFCMRAAKAGWRNVLAADVFVFHEGGVSFSAERHELMRAAGKRLLEVHPEYTRIVHEFVMADPAGKLRDAIDLARAVRGAAEAECVLHERADERARLVKGLWEIDRVAAERDTRIGQLNYALEHASARIANRDEVLAQKEVEIARLREGLANAEALAFSRLDELDRMKSSRFWRALRLARRITRGSA